MDGLAILIILIGIISIVALIASIVSYIYLPKDSTKTTNDTLYIIMVCNGTIAFLFIITLFIETAKAKLVAGGDNSGKSSSKSIHKSLSI